MKNYTELNLFRRKLWLIACIPFIIAMAASCTQTSSDTDGYAYDPLLKALPEAIEAADMNYARIDADYSTAYTGPQSVRVTKGLLKGIGNAILAGNPKQVEPPLRSFSSSGESRMVTIQFPYGENQHIVIDLYDNTDQQPDQTVMSMQFGEDMAQYTLERTAFEEIYDLIVAQIFPIELLLEGNYTRYFFEGIDAGAISPGLQDILEVNDSLLFLWNNLDICWVDAVNPKTGEAEKVWEYALPDNAKRSWFKLESTDFTGHDYRIIGSGMAVYRKSKDPSISLKFEAPQEISRSDRFSYDICPQAGLVAWSTEDGVYVGSENNMARILDHKDATPSQNLGETDLPEEFDAYYGDVHFMNDGQFLAAAVIHPGSQSGLHALALVEIKSGKVTIFEDLFSAMIAKIHYLDERTIAAAAESNEWVTIIDVRTGEIKRLPFDESGLTYDFTTWVDLRQEKGEDGIPTGFVEAYRAETPDQAKQLLKVTGEHAWVRQVTQNYAILVCRDSREAFAAIIPL